MSLKSAAFLLDLPIRLNSSDVVSSALFVARKVHSFYGGFLAQHDPQAERRVVSRSTDLTAVDK
jgi:hypothetical protein